MTERRAFSLIEVIVTLSVLGGLTLMVFGVFAMGSTGFRVGTGRLDLQSDLRRILSPLRADLQNSSFQTVSSLSQTTGVPEKPPRALPTISVRRDGICLNGLLDGQSNTSYQTGSGLPQWDCYICYFATLDSPDGKLVRLLLKDPSHDELSVPRALSASDLTAANPDLLQKSVKVLSDRILEFGVTLDPSNQLVELHLRVRSQAGRQMAGGRSLVEILEVRSAVFPSNTNPRL